MNHKIFYSAYDIAQVEGFSVEDSINIANKVVKASPPKIVSGKKSFTLASNVVNSGNTIDILVGYPEADTESIYGGKTLDSDGWSTIPTKSFTFDLNHFNYDAKIGARNDLDEKWHTFAIKVDNFYSADDGLHAKAYIPESDDGEEFLKDYLDGKYGVSIEYSGEEHDNLIKNWEITGGTFHTDPSYSKTKPKGL